MTTLEDAEVTLSFVTLEEDNLTLLINGDPKWAVKLPDNIFKKDGNRRRKIVKKTILGGCDKFKIDYVTDENLSNLAREVVNDLSNRIKEQARAESGEEEDEEEKKQTVRAKQALELAMAHSKELFVNEFGRPFAAMKMPSDGHVEVHPMDESKFKNWISGIFYSTHDQLLSDDDLKKIVRILTAKADFDGNIPRRKLDVRVRGYNAKEYNSGNVEDVENSGGVGSVGSVSSFGELVEDFDSIYYDLTNKKWEAIKITPEGWEIDKHPPFLFRRFGGEAPQVYPDRNYELGVLDKWVDLLNLKPEYAELQKVVVKVKQVTDLWPNTTPKPIVILQSSQGSGKTTAFELMRDMVDPNSALTMSMPKDEAQLKQSLAHNYMAFFDNLSDITDGQSNILCRGVTGAGDTKRKLYENDEDIVYGYRRIEGINGITNIVTKSDLLDRGLAVDFAEIPKDKRELLRIIRKNHLELKPKVLAFCLDVITEVMAERKKWKGVDDYYFGMKDLIDKNGGLPRMADWALLGEQVATVIARKEGVEYKSGTFLEAFDKNLDILNTEALKSSLVAEALIAFMTNREVMLNTTEWEGSATMLLSALNSFIEVNSDSIKINIRARAWPQDPAAIGRELAKIKPNLSPLGIIIESFRTNKNVLYKITKIPLHSPEDLHNLHNLHENEDNIQNRVGSVGRVGKDSDEGGIDMDKIIQALPKDEQGYFMGSDLTYKLTMLPIQHPLHCDINQADQTLQALIDEGKIREVETGKYAPSGGS